MAARSTLTYEIGRFNAICDQTQAPLNPGDTFYAALIAGDGEHLQRLNIAAKAWESGDRPRGAFAYWRATVHHPDAKPADTIDHDSLLSLFESIDPEEPDDTKLAFRFILALLLQRKRILLPAHAATDPNALALVPKSNRDSTPFIVNVPELNANQLATLTDQLRAVLNLGDES